MDIEDTLNDYTFKDMGVDKTDRPGYRLKGHLYVSSPYFRSRYYVFGYVDYYRDGIARQDQGIHPDNEAAYWQGWNDARGDKERARNW